MILQGKFDSEDALKFFDWFCDQEGPRNVALHFKSLNGSREEKFCITISEFRGKNFPNSLFASIMENWGTKFVQLSRV